MTHPAPGVAIVGVGAILPDAPDAQTFWRNNVDSSVKVDGGYGTQTRNHLCWPVMTNNGCIFY